MPIYHSNPCFGYYKVINGHQFRGRHVFFISDGSGEGTVTKFISYENASTLILKQREGKLAPRIMSRRGKKFLIKSLYINLTFLKESIIIFKFGVAHDRVF